MSGEIISFAERRRQRQSASPAADEQIVVPDDLGWARAIVEACENDPSCLFSVVHFCIKEAASNQITPRDRADSLLVAWLCLNALFVGSPGVDSPIRLGELIR